MQSFHPSAFYSLLFLHQLLRVSFDWKYAVAQDELFLACTIFFEYEGMWAVPLYARQTDYHLLGS